MLSRTSAVLALGLVSSFASFGFVGCEDSERNEALSQPDGADDDARAAEASSAPYRVTCTISYGEKTAGRTASGETALSTSSMVFFTDQPSETQIDVGGRGVPVRGAVANVAGDPTKVALTVEFPQAGTLQEYRLGRTEMPTYELSKSQGFTGTVAVAIPSIELDVSYSCEASARDEERPRPSPIEVETQEPSERQRPPELRVRCDATDIATGRTETQMFSTWDDRVLTPPPSYIFGSIWLGVRINQGMFQWRTENMAQWMFLDPSKAFENITLGVDGLGSLTGVTTFRARTRSPHSEDAGTGNEGGATDGGLEADGGHSDAGETDGGNGPTDIMFSCRVEPSAPLSRSAGGRRMTEREPRDD